MWYTEGEISRVEYKHGVDPRRGVGKVGSWRKDEDGESPGLGQGDPPREDREQ